VHEMSIVQALTLEIGEHLPPEASLIRVVVEVGSLEHLDETVMQTAWDAVIMDKPLEGAKLDVERIAVRVRCRSCATEYAPEVQSYLACPDCGEARPEVLAGWGVTLRTLEADVPSLSSEKNEDRNQEER